MAKQYQERESGYDSSGYWDSTGLWFPYQSMPLFVPIAPAPAMPHTQRQPLSLPFSGNLHHVSHPMTSETSSTIQTGGYHIENSKNFHPEPSIDSTQMLPYLTLPSYVSLTIDRSPEIDIRYECMTSIYDEEVPLCHINSGHIYNEAQPNDSTVTTDIDEGQCQASKAPDTSPDHQNPTSESEQVDHDSSYIDLNLIKPEDESHQLQVTEDEEADTEKSGTPQLVDVSSPLDITTANSLLNSETELCELRQKEVIVYGKITSLKMKLEEVREEKADDQLSTPQDEGDVLASADQVETSRLILTEVKLNDVDIEHTEDDLENKWRRVASRFRLALRLNRRRLLVHWMYMHEAKYNIKVEVCYQFDQSDQSPFFFGGYYDDHDSLQSLFCLGDGYDLYDSLQSPFCLGDGYDDHGSLQSLLCLGDSYDHDDSLQSLFCLGNGYDHYDSLQSLFCLGDSYDHDDSLQSLFCLGDGYDHFDSLQSLFFLGDGYDHDDSLQLLFCLGDSYDSLLLSLFLTEPISAAEQRREARHSIVAIWTMSMWQFCKIQNILGSGQASKTLHNRTQGSHLNSVRHVNVKRALKGDPSDDPGDSDSCKTAMTKMLNFLLFLPSDSVVQESAYSPIDLTDDDLNVNSGKYKYVVDSDEERMVNDKQSEEENVAGSDETQIKGESGTTRTDGLEKSPEAFEEGWNRPIGKPTISGQETNASIEIDVASRHRGRELASKRRERELPSRHSYTQKPMQWLLLLMLVMVNTAKASPGRLNINLTDLHGNMHANCHISPQIVISVGDQHGLISVGTITLVYVTECTDSRVMSDSNVPHVGHVEAVKHIGRKPTAQQKKKRRKDKRSIGMPDRLSSTGMKTRTSEEKPVPCRSYKFREPEFHETCTDMGCLPCNTKATQSTDNTIDNEIPEPCLSYRFRGRRFREPEELPCSADEVCLPSSSEKEIVKKILDLHIQPRVTALARRLSRCEVFETVFSRVCDYCKCKRDQLLEWLSGLSLEMMRYSPRGTKVEKPVRATVISQWTDNRRGTCPAERFDTEIAILEGILSAGQHMLEMLLQPVCGNVTSVDTYGYETIGRKLLELEDPGELHWCSRFKTEWGMTDFYKATRGYDTVTCHWCPPSSWQGYESVDNTTSFPLEPAEDGDSQAPMLYAVPSNHGWLAALCLFLLADFTYLLVVLLLLLMLLECLRQYIIGEQQQKLFGNTLDVKNSYQDCWEEYFYTNENLFPAVNKYKEFRPVDNSNINISCFTKNSYEGDGQVDDFIVSHHIENTYQGLSEVCENNVEKSQSQVTCEEEFSYDENISKVDESGSFDKGPYDSSEASNGEKGVFKIDIGRNIQQGPGEADGTHFCDDKLNESCVIKTDNSEKGSNVEKEQHDSSEASNREKHVFKIDIGGNNQQGSADEDVDHDGDSKHNESCEKETTNGEKGSNVEKGQHDSSEASNREKEVFKIDIGGNNQEGSAEEDVDQVCDNKHKESCEKKTTNVEKGSNVEKGQKDENEKEKSKFQKLPYDKICQMILNEIMVFLLLRSEEKAFNPVGCVVEDEEDTEELFEEECFIDDGCIATVGATHSSEIDTKPLRISSDEWIYVPKKASRNSIEKLGSCEPIPEDLDHLPERAAPHCTIDDATEIKQVSCQTDIGLVLDENDNPEAGRSGPIATENKIVVAVRGFFNRPVNDDVELSKRLDVDSDGQGHYCLPRPVPAPSEIDQVVTQEVKPGVPRVKVIPLRHSPNEGKIESLFHEYMSANEQVKLKKDRRWQRKDAYTFEELTKKVLRDHTWLPLDLLPPARLDLTTVVVANITYAGLDAIFRQIALGNTPGPAITMKYELLRLCTLRNYPKINKPYLIRLAASGFYYAADGDEVVCYCCGVRRNGWAERDVPDDVHKRLSPKCSFFARNGQVNYPVPRQLEGATNKFVFLEEIVAPSVEDEGEDQSYDNRGPATRQQLTQRGDGETPVVTNSSRMNTSAMGINTSSPKHPHYAVKSVRINSFVGWPESSHQDPAVLAEAGFYFAGIGDCVRCFYCGVGLRHWAAEDNPWIEHARWAQTCAYLRQYKGDEFISLVHMAINITRDEEPSAPGSQPNEEITRVLMTDAAQSVVEMGYDTRIIRRAIDSILRDTGRAGVTAQRIMEKVLELEEEQQNVADEPAPTPPPTRELAQLAINKHNIYPGDSGNPGNEATPPVSGAGSQTGAVATTDTVAASKGDNQVGKVILPASKKSGSHGNAVVALPGQDPKKVKEENEKLKEQTLCKICMDRTVCIVFLPCGHLVTCAECAPALRKCPICRSLVKGTVKTYMS